MLYKKNRAMTFAELALVLTIIGVISALVLPGLKKYSQKTELGEQTRNVYLTLEDMLDNAILSEGPIRNWDFDSSTFFERYVVPNVKYTSASKSYVYTMDGAKLTLLSCDGSMCQIQADVNGDKYPNLSGKDIHVFQITKDGDDDYYRPETVQPLEGSAAELLRLHNWKFSDNLWDCTSNSCTY